MDLLLSLDMTRASGLPRLVTRRGSPVRATFSSNARQCALKVEIATDFMVIRVDHIKPEPARRTFLRQLLVGQLLATSTRGSPFFSTHSV